jgi:hypothetical protein
MSPTLFAVVLATTVTAPAPVEEDVKPPKGPQPLQVLAHVAEDGNIEITQVLTVYRAETRTRVVNVNGTPVSQQYTVTVPQAVPVTRRLLAKSVQVSTAGGKAVDPKDVPAKLKKPTPVLLSADGNKIDPFYLKIVKEGTLVLVMPGFTVGEVRPPSLPQPPAPGVAPPVAKPPAP